MSHGSGAGREEGCVGHGEGPGARLLATQVTLRHAPLAPRGELHKHDLRTGASTHIIAELLPHKPKTVQYVLFAGLTTG